MTKPKSISLMTATLYVALSLLSSSCNGQTNKEHKQHQSGHSHQAFADKEAVEKMAKNFESAERDSIQQPQKVLQFMGNLKGKKIMDIGAATGYFSVKFANAGATVIAADVSEGFQEYLKNRIEKEKIENIELRKIPYDNPLLKENEADIAFVANTYHHIENRVAYFSKVHKGLRPDGELIVLDYFKVEFEEKVQAPAMTMRVSVDEVIFELKKAGFDSFEIEVNLLAYQYIVRAKKKV
jgi:ubiquinone/menaquinone biosynthesis C-methylase UbiE